MSRESSLWRYVREGMGRRWHATRHEDALTAGIPDVSYGICGVQGWIELKVVERAPLSGVIRVRHFTKEQRAWLKARGSHGNRTWLLLKIERRTAPRAYLLFPWRTLDMVGECNMDELNGGSLGGRWHSSIDFDEFAKAITQTG